MDHVRRAVFAVIASMVVLMGGLQAIAQESEGAANPFGPDELVVVVGGSGQTGQLIVQRLKDMGVGVRATTRDVAAARAEIDPDIEWVEALASDTAALDRALEGASYAVSAIGNSKDPENVDYRGVANAVDAAKKAGVKRFVLISSGGVTHGPDHFLNRTFNNLLEWKFKGEVHLRDSGLDYTIVRPNGLRDEIDGAGENTSVFFLQGDGRFPGVIERSRLAEVIVAALTHPDASRKTFEAITAFAVMPDQWTSQFQYLKADD